MPLSLTNSLVRILQASIVGLQMTGGVARVTVPTSGVNAVPFVTASRDFKTWTEPEQTVEMVSSWHHVVTVQAQGERGFYKAWYRVYPVE
jgi:hypothetical protein